MLPPLKEGLLLSDRQKFEDCTRRLIAADSDLMMKDENFIQAISHLYDLCRERKEPEIFI